MPFSNNAGTLAYALVAFSHKLTNDVLCPKQTQTEFLEYCEGDWMPLDELQAPSRATA